jgi:hypothetical protein
MDETTGRQGRDTGDGDAPGRGGLTPGRRRALVYGMIGLACVVALASTLTVWVQRQLLDTDRWTETSSELLQDADVREAVSLRIVDALFDDPSVVEGLRMRLPPALDPLAEPIAAGLRNVALDRADTFLQRPTVQSVWEEVNRRAHTRLVAVLRGDDGELVTTTGGEVVLDLTPLVASLRAELGIGGAPRPGAAEFVLMESDELAAAQDAVATLDVLSPVLLVVVLALLAGAVYLAEGFRRQAVRATALGLLVVGLVLLVVRRLVGDAVVEARAEPPTRSAAATVWLVGTEVLGEIALGLVAIGLVGLVWAVLSGPTRPARAIRSWIAPAMRDHAAAVHAGVLVVALLVLAWGPTGAPRRLVGTIVMIALVVGGVEALRRQTAREHPADAVGAGHPAP